VKRKSLTILFLLFISFSLYSQESKQKNPGRIGITYWSFLNNQVERNARTRYYDYPYDDGGDYRYKKRFYSIGLNYIKSLNTWLEYETGLEYSRKASSTRIVYPDTYSDLVVSKSSTKLLSIPLTLRANFLKIYYINSGLFVDFDLGGNNPSRYRPGIGLLYGIAAEFDFKHGFSFFVNPYFKNHSIIQFSSDEQQLKVNEAGVRFGLTYDLKRTK